MASWTSPSRPLASPTPTTSYVSTPILARVAETSIEVQVAALNDVEHSKRTADRPKDRTYPIRVGRLQPPQDG